MPSTNNIQTISSSLHNQRADVAAAQLWPEYSRSQLTQWIKQGLITINQHTIKPKNKVSTGDEIILLIDESSLTSQENPHQPENIPLDIIYEDDSLIIINKPAGLVVHPGAGNANHTLVNALLHHAPTLVQLPRAGLIHRLDKDTTGLLVIAKTLTAQTDLTRQLQQRDIQRHYLALVHGPVIAGGEIDTFYGRHPRNRLKMAVCRSGRQAVTHYKVDRRYPGLTLLDVSLLTGRTHQIRVHMAHINHPVVGDQLYGGRSRIPANLDDTTRQALLQFKRQALHAAQLSFAHPVTGSTMTFDALLPDDFQQLINQLEQYAE